MRRPPDHEDPDALTDMDDPTDPIGAAIAATVATIAAPATLRERVARDHERAGRRRTRGRLLGGGVIGLATALVIAVLLVLPGSSQPSVADAAKLALASPDAAAPGPGATPGTLDASVSGVAFPTWDGWRAVGERTRDVAGRSARSVVYEDASGQRVGYAIVSGKPLDVPDGTRHRVNGAELTSLRSDGATVVTWRVDGHTCVLATADDVPVEGLVRFAATTY
jgi:hypothetical protein